jgi:hypothetical protein
MVLLPALASPGDLLPPEAHKFLDQGGWWLVAAVGVLAALAFLVALANRLRRRSAAQRDALWERGLRENLAEYPPPPGKPGSSRLLVVGVPARLRLVVLAPVGKLAQVNPDTAGPLLDHVVHALGKIAQQDKPRIRVWPPQLSQHGFAVTFHRLTQKPEPDGQLSRWVLLAGQARVGVYHILLGLALLTDEKTSVGRRTLRPEQWTEVLRIRTPEG